MRDRYERLFTLPGLLYVMGAPIIIEAGALLKDNQFNGVVAQLKFRNISDNVIKAVTVIFFSYDTAQRPLGESVTFQYLDLSAKRDDFFGQDVPVSLPDPGTRAFFVSVQEVIFENNEVWNSGDNAWQSLPAAVSLEDFFKDLELMKQFKIHYGSDCSVCPVQIGDLWYCTCGNINHINELACHFCGKNANDLFHVDLNVLAQEKEERLQKETWEKQMAEQKEAAEQSQKEAEKKARIEEARIKKEKNKQQTKDNAKIASVVIVICLFFFGIYMFIQPKLENNHLVKKYGQNTVDKYGVAFFRKYGEAFIDQYGIELFERFGSEFVDRYGIQVISHYEPVLFTNYDLDTIEKYGLNLIALHYKRDLLQEGDVIFFGNYEQDNNTANGKELVRWIVLEKSDSKILLISEDILDVREFDDRKLWDYYDDKEAYDVTWSNSSLRRWLNIDFLGSSFSPREKSIIQKTSVRAEKNPEFDTDPGYDTQDYIFILSLQEAAKYFSTDTDRKARVSATIAFSKEYAEYHKNEEFWYWWLRTPGRKFTTDWDGGYCIKNNLCYRKFVTVSKSGYIYSTGSDAFIEEGVRPALWINLKYLESMK